MCTLHLPLGPRHSSFMGLCLQAKRGDSQPICGPWGFLYMQQNVTCLIASLSPWTQRHTFTQAFSPLWNQNPSPGQTQLLMCVTEAFQNGLRTADDTLRASWGLGWRVLREAGGWGFYSTLCSIKVPKWHVHIIKQCSPIWGQGRFHLST